MHWAGPGFFLGEAGIFLLSEPLGWEWLAALGTPLGVVLVWRRNWPVLWILAGFVWVSTYVQWHWHPLDAGLEGRDLTVTGRIEGLPVKRPWGWRFNFKVDDRAAAREVPELLRLSWYGKPRLEAGQRWQLQVRLKRPHGFANPGGFDYERWLFTHHIGATGYVRSRGPNRLLTESGGLAGLRQHLADYVDDTLAGSPYHGVVKALVVGVRDGIDEDQWAVLRRTGTAHLVAISGLHVGLVAGLLFWSGRSFWLRFGHWRLGSDQAGVLLALPGAVGYAALAGFSVPTQRALIMLGVGFGAVLWRRRSGPWQPLGLALLTVCLIDPLAPLTPGFWLSFGAVGWILFALSGRLRRPRWPLLRVQGYLLVGLAPFLVFFFKQVGWAAPLANLIAVPIMTFGVVPWVLSGGIGGMWLPDVGSILLALGARVLDWLWWGLSWLAELPGVVWSTVAPPLWSLPLVLLGLGWLLAPRGLPGRWLGGVFLVPLVWVPSPRPDTGELWLTVLEVGQGLSVVVETTDHALVFDTGPHFSERFDAGADIIAPFLQQRGRRHLDKIIVSHGDSDHSGGLAGLLRHYSARVLTSAEALFSLPDVAPCRSGQKWLWNGVRFTMLWPESSVSAESENDRSCVLKIEAGGGNVLLPGDIEKAGETALVNRYGSALKSPLMIAPHHGSTTSSSWLFLRKVQPDYVFISSGYRNRFDFPRPEIVDRYRKIHAQVFNTATDGALQVRVGANGVVVRGWRQIHRSLWAWKPVPASAGSVPP
ncbi:MAG: DNA internalization-related competence protein ComEC/Rec2 [Methylohalobius sp. ZOD2]